MNSTSIYFVPSESGTLKEKSSYQNTKFIIQIPKLEGKTFSSGYMSFR